MLTVVIVKALLEVAGLALLGQGILYVLAGAGRERNVFYRVLQLIASPAVRVTRFITPRRLVPDRFIGAAAFFLVAGLWLAAGIAKVQMCHETPTDVFCAEAPADR